jgi:putative CocE/NonD family hydrolase
MGPWTHGAWAGPTWTKFGSHDFGANLNLYYKELETKFFNFYLKDKGSFTAAEATVFETGSNQWKNYDQWPPANATTTAFYFQADKKLSTAKPKGNKGFDEYTSDPNQPVPYTDGTRANRNNEYVVEDQRFASKRSDVIFFETDPLTEDMTVTGRLKANLFVSTSGTDADFIVKLIDVLPDNEPNPDPNPRNFQMAGFQRMVRAEVFRGKFRNSYEKPEAFTPNKIEKVSFDMNEIAHVFKKGHRIMVQVQSSWFPIVDRNPQKFLKIPDAAENDFQKATIRIYHDAVNASNIILPILK